MFQESLLIQRNVLNESLNSLTICKTFYNLLCNPSFVSNNLYRMTQMVKNLVMFMNKKPLYNINIMLWN